METIVTSQSPLKVIEVNHYARGRQGLKGDKGDEGDPGSSIRIVGPWSAGVQYGPLDGVTARSSSSAAITSLFVHRSGGGSAPVGVEPRLATSSWVEVGISTLGDALGGVWTVTQPAHGFTHVGTPVTVSGGNYVMASAQTLPDAAIGVVREIIDSSTLVIQSSGFIPSIAPEVDITDPGNWVVGQDYWLSPVPGRIRDGAPSGTVAQRVLRILSVNGDGTANGALILSNDLPITPVPTPVPAASKTDMKLDNIAGSFDGSTLEFPLTAAAVAVGFPLPATSLAVYIDGHRQEPEVDYQVVETGVGTGEAAIRFTEAPEDYETFFCVMTLALGVASAAGIGATLPPTADAGSLFLLTEGQTGLYIYFDDGTSAQWMLVDSLGSAP